MVDVVVGRGGDGGEQKVCCSGYRMAIAEPSV